MSQTPTIDNALFKLLPGSFHPGPTIRVNPSEVELLRGSEVRIEPISWLWNGWLASGKTHILAGAPGTGKTTISLALAAAMTCGGRWPDGSTAPLANVVYWSGEDDPADTLAPRLIAAGADLKRVYFISGVLENNKRRSFDPAQDMAALDRAFMQIAGKVSLIIVDPIVSAVSGDSNNNADTRRCLQPLVDLAASRGCALLGISHFAKNTSGRDPIDRLNGSVAFGAVARVVMVAAKIQPKEGNERPARVLLRAKSNIGPDNGGYKYDLQQSELKENPGIFASSILWGEQIVGSAREILAEAEAIEDGDSGALGEAKAFLADLLSNGPLPQPTIKKEAAGSDIAWATVRRAKTSLGVQARKSGMTGGWEWALPSRCSEYHEDAQQKNMSTFGENEHLQEVENTKMLKNIEDAHQNELGTLGNGEHLPPPSAFLAPVNLDEIVGPSREERKKSRSLAWEGKV